MDDLKEREALKESEAPPQTLIFDSGTVNISAKVSESELKEIRKSGLEVTLAPASEQTLLAEKTLKETGQYPNPGEPLHKLENGILTVTATGDPETDKEEIAYILNNLGKFGDLNTVVQYPLKEGKTSVGTLKGFMEELIDELTKMETAEIWEREQAAIYEWPQIKALSASELEAITPYLKDTFCAYYADIAEFGIANGTAHISDIANYTNMDTGKTFAEEIIERAQLIARGGLRSTGGHRVKIIEYPIDKVNNTIWNLLEENTHGQITLNLKAEPNSKNHKKVDITYSIDFDNIESDLPIVKRLTPFDKRVYIAVGALWSAGNDSVTVEQIYQAMGYDGKIGAAMRKKIDASMTKFHAIVTIDNGQEIAAHYKYPRSGVDGPLLPFYRGREYKNGQLTAVYVITLYVKGKRISKIPLIEFAAGRGQVTQLPRKVLQTPLSKTDENLRIEDYCIERIAQYKREGKKILLSTLYSKCEITSRKQKERAPEKIERLFDYYKDCGEVKDYKFTDTKDAIIFEV